MDKKTMIILGIIIVGVIFFAKKEAILPSGYNVDLSCTWATNVDPMTSRSTDYGNSGAWISIDVNGDGVWEKFGRKATGTTTSTWTYDKVVEDYNSYGDDIYYDGANLRVRSSTSYTLLELDYGAASNAITPDCAGGTPDCTQGQTSCVGDSLYTCNAAGTYELTTTCTYGCSDGQCLTSSSCWTFNEMVQQLNDNWVGCS